MNKYLAAQIAYGHCPVSSDLREELNRMDEDSAKEEELLDRIDAKVEDINAEITLWNEAVIEYAASRSDRTERFNKALYNTVFMNPAPLGIFTEAAVKWYARELVEK